MRCLDGIIDSMDTSAAVMLLSFYQMMKLCDIPHKKESPVLLTGNHDCPASFMFSYYFFYRKYVNLVSVESTQYLAHKSNF